MSEQQTTEQWAENLRELAREFPYPPTPDLVHGRRRRRSGQRFSLMAYRWQWARGALLLLVLLLALLAVPEVRAGVLRVLQIGTVRIFLAEPTPAVPTSLVATPTPLAALRDLAGATTLASAQARVDFPLRLPAYPPDLGPPDQVYLQDQDGTALIMVWLDAARPNGIRMSLHILSSPLFADPNFATKTGVMTVEETTVNGARALWVRGPHLYQINRDGLTGYDARRLVEGNVLIWAEGTLTYRLESDLPLDEARRAAESLR